MHDLRVLTGDEVADEPLSWPIVARTRCWAAAWSATSSATRSRRPTARRMMRDYLLHPGAVGVIALDDAERVVVVRQLRHPVGFRLVEPPAGLLDADGETWLSAAERELAEEAQLAASDWRVLVDFMTSPGCLQEALRVFLARGLSRVGRPDGFVVEHEEADMDVCLVALDDLVDAIYAGRIQNPTMVVGRARRLRRAAHRAGGRAARGGRAVWPATRADANAARDARMDALRAGRRDGRWRWPGPSRPTSTTSRRRGGGVRRTRSPATGATSPATRTSWRRRAWSRGRGRHARARRARSRRGCGRGQDRRRLAASSVARAVAAVRSFHAFAVRDGDAEQNPAVRVSPPKQGKRLPKALSVDQVQALLDVPDRTRRPGCGTPPCSSCCTARARGSRRWWARRRRREPPSSTTRTWGCGCSARDARSGSCRWARTRGRRWATGWCGGVRR